MGKKIEGVRFYRWGGFSFGDIPEYVLCMDGKCGKVIWVNIVEFKRGERKFGYDCYARDVEKVKLSPKQEARVAAYLQEYEQVLDYYIKVFALLCNVDKTIFKMEDECPSFREDYLWKIKDKLDALKFKHKED